MANKHLSTQDATFAVRSLQSFNMYGNLAVRFTFNKTAPIKTFKVKCRKRGLSRKVSYRYLSAYFKQVLADEFYQFSNLPLPNFKQERK